jgi:hypothetical protein
MSTTGANPSSGPDRTDHPHGIDGRFPTHSVSVAAPGTPYTKYFTTVGAFKTDAEAIAGALEDWPFHEIRVMRHDGAICYDSKTMKGKQ